jgi:hypothetical protein
LVIPANAKERRGNTECREYRSVESAGNLGDTTAASAIESIAAGQITWGLEPAKLSFTLSDDSSDTCHATHAPARVYQRGAMQAFQTPHQAGDASYIDALLQPSFQVEQLTAGPI